MVKSCREDEHFGTLVDDAVGDSEPLGTNRLALVAVVTHGQMEDVVAAVYQRQQFLVALADHIPVIVNVESAFLFVKPEGRVEDEQHAVP